MDERVTGPTASRVAPTGILIGAAAALSLVALVLPPIHDLPGYHAFGDQRSALGVRHFWNTVTNAAFVAVGLYGLVVVARRRQAGLGPERRAYVTVFAGAVLVGIGSVAYHQRPDDASLFWDRLPMTVVFAGVLAAAISDRISARAGAWLLLPLIALGALGVEIWRRGALAGTGDLRLYVLVQYGSMVLLVLTLSLFPARYSHGHFWWWALAWYGAAKVFELSDELVWEVTRALTGGHALKHVAAACAVLALAEMVRRRSGSVSRETSSRGLP